MEVDCALRETYPEGVLLSAAGRRFLERQKQEKRNKQMF